jgi:hypothetical protein
LKQRLKRSRINSLTSKPKEPTSINKKATYKQ